jgi:PAS domain S-box-containing protein
MQEAFRQSKEQLAMAVEAAGLGIFDWDLETDMIVWSANSAKLLGLAGDDCKGTYENFQACVHPDDRAGLKAAVKESLQILKEFLHEFRVIRSDGSEHWIEGRGKVFRDYNEHPARLMGTMMDVSQRKVSEEAAKIRELELTRLARAKLTPREVTLLKQVASGSPNKRIASNLKISIRTVAKHRAHLMAKTHALNAADLARMCTLAGILPDK